MALRLRAIAIRHGPQSIVVSRREIESTARVVANGVPRLRLGANIGDTRADIGVAFRINAHSWLNAVLSLSEQGNGGFPTISARVGNVPLPAFVVKPLLLLAQHFAELRAGVQFPRPQDMILAFDAKSDHVTARLALPRGLLYNVLNLAPENDDAIDGVLVDQIYARMTKRLVASPRMDLATVYAEAFKDAPKRGTAARRYARAVMVAVAMTTVGPPARRLAGDMPPPDTLKETRFPVELAERYDLAKHFSLSAALAATANVELGRALGTWKELDDSLPGGSGFSFVDLAADRAGLRFGQAALDPDRAARLVRLLQHRTKLQLLPNSVLRFDEGLDDKAFRARFGDIETGDYALVIAQIDRSLDALPLMQR